MKSKYKSIALGFLTVFFLSACMIRSAEESINQIDVVSEADMDSDSVGEVESLLDPEDEFEKLTDYIIYEKLPDERDYRKVHLLNSESYEIGDRLGKLIDNGWYVSNVEESDGILNGEDLFFLELYKDSEVIGVVGITKSKSSKLEDYEILGFGFEENLVSNVRVGTYRLNEKLSDLNNETILMKNDDTVLMLSTDEDEINNLFVYDRSLID